MARLSRRSWIRQALGGLVAAAAGPELFGRVVAGRHVPAATAPALARDARKLYRSSGGVYRHVATITDARVTHYEDRS